MKAAKNPTGTFSTSISKPFTKDYRDLLKSILNWRAIFLVVVMALVIRLVGYTKSPLLFYLAIQVPTLLACWYVVSPNPNLLLRLPINWLFTSILVFVLVGIKRFPDMPIDKRLVGTVVGLTILTITVYWIASAIQWGIKTTRYNPDRETALIDVLAKLFATWGISLQALSILGMLARRFIEINDFDSPITNLILKIFNLIDTISILRFMPVGIIGIGFLILVGLQLNNEEFKPIGFSSILNTTNPMLNGLVAPFRIPTGVLLNIIKFLYHMAKLIWYTIQDFFSGYIARLVFIVMGLILGPLLLSAGHFIFIDVIYRVNLFVAQMHPVGSNLIDDLISFISINVQVLVALCFYVIAIPFLASRYRNENIRGIIDSIKKEFIDWGVPAMNAVMMGLALYGTAPLTIFIARLPIDMPFLPVEIPFDNYATFYMVIIVIALVVAGINLSRHKISTDA